MCLSTKGERASAQTKHFKRIYQSISEFIVKYVVIVTLITTSNSNPLVYVFYVYIYTILLVVCLSTNGERALNYTIVK